MKTSQVAHAFLYFYSYSRNSKLDRRDFLDVGQVRREVGILYKSRNDLCRAIGYSSCRGGMPLIREFGDRAMGKMAGELMSIGGRRDGIVSSGKDQGGDVRTHRIVFAGRGRARVPELAHFRNGSVQIFEG